MPPATSSGSGSIDQWSDTPSARAVAERVDELVGEVRGVDRRCRGSPARASASICQTMSGLPPTSSSGFGVASDSGRIRSPRPAARIIAPIARPRHQSVYPAPRARPSSSSRSRSSGRERVVALARAAQVAPSRAACRRGSRPCRRGGRAARRCPSTLSWRCTPIHSKSRQNAPKSASTGKPRRARALPVAHRPVDLPLLVPLDVGVAQQRHEVVGDRAVHRVLEIEDAGIGLAHHQVARVVVAVHEDARLREIVVEDERGTPAASVSRCAASSAMPRCLATYQSGKSSSSRAQQRLVVGRQRAVARGLLPADQRVDRVAVERRRRRRVERLEVGRVPRSVRSRKPRSRSSREHSRRVHAGVREQRARRGRTAGSPPSAAARPSRSASRAPRHGVVERDAEVAAEARVGRRRRERECGAPAARSRQLERGRGGRRSRSADASPGDRKASPRPMDVGRSALTVECADILAASRRLSRSSVVRRPRRHRRARARAPRRRCARGRCRLGDAPQRADTARAADAAPSRELAPAPHPAASRLRAPAPARATPQRPAARLRRRRRARRDLPARRPARGRRAADRSSAEGQGRAAHAPRDGARRLAALRLRARRDLAQGRRADAPRHRLDHRAGARASSASTETGFFTSPTLLRRRERRARQRGGDHVRRPRPLRGHRRALHDLRRAARGLVPPDGRARGRHDAAWSAPGTTRRCASSARRSSIRRGSSFRCRTSASRAS